MDPATIIQTAILVFLAGGAWHDLKAVLRDLSSRLDDIEKRVMDLEETA